MTAKAECNNPKCRAQITINTPAMDGWLQIQQFKMFQQVGDQPPVTGDFCTIACAIEYLQSKQPRMEEMDERFQADGGRDSGTPPQDSGGEPPRT